METIAPTDRYAPAVATSSTPTAARRDALAAALGARIRGEVQFGTGDRALYATDSSNYRQLPIGVVRPLDTDDLVETLRVCREADAPVTLRGAGTSLAGQAANVAVIVDVSRHLDRILEVDPARRIARVQPGVVLDDLRAAAERHGLTFGPDPATHDRCTLGGMLGNDSCGAHSIMAGRTSDNVESLDVLTYDGVRLTVGRTSDAELARLCAEPGRVGEIYRGLRDLRDRYGTLIRERFPTLPRLVSGFPLQALLPDRGFDVARALIGTEGTCVTILEATVRLVPSPPARILLVLGFPDVFAAADRTPEVMTAGPIALEGFDDRLVEACRRKGLNRAAIAGLPDGGGWLLVEFGADTPAEAEAKARSAAERFGRGTIRARVVTDRAEQTAMWTLRESAVGATAVVPGKPSTYPGWEDSAVPPSRLGAYMRELDELIGRFGFERTFYGHFGDGCLHLRSEFDFRSAAGLRDFRAFIEQAADLVVRHGGSLSGEHGDGQARGELLERMFGSELVGAFREFKAIWDPAGRMNPGKVVDARPLDADLRPALPLAEPRTIFAFTDDGGSLARAVQRCVGVGKCRSESGAMCPTFKATAEERHSTRGRARLLWEMLEGSAIPGGWRSEEVREALDLCIGCKACKTECPVQVDMASYKAEFMANHYAGRLRPRAAYSMGLIHWWAHLAAIAPGLANSVGTVPGIAGLAKLVAGVDSRRDLPRFAEMTFRRGLGSKVPDLGSLRGSEGRVILFADTFTDGFAPKQGMAAMRVLEAAGFRAEVPRANLCCGRPLFDRGFLRQARRLLGEILDAFEPALESRVPIIVLEPSCEAVFHDELLQLFPRDPRARRLSELVCGLGTFVERRPDVFGPALRRRLPGPAMLHGHCHQKATVGMAAEEAVLHSIGVEPAQPEAGCCGMAGSFGFERGDHYELSMKIGEKALLPAVRSSSLDSLVIADGFSCREQIAQSTGRRPLHLAEVLELALGTPGGPD